MKNKIILIGITTFLIAALLSSCSKDDAPVVYEKPTVEISEVGANNSKIAYPGNDLHLEADIVAPGKIANIKLQITLATTNYGWDLVKTYTKNYEGLKNATFHEHVDVPADARAGMYTLVLVVTDEQGQKTLTKTDFEIVKDPSLPVITGISLKTISPTVLNISGTIKAPNKINHLLVEVQSSSWTKPFTFTDVDMVGQTSFVLNKDLDITGAPAGHYHVNVKVIDQAGKSMLYQFHLDR